MGFLDKLKGRSKQLRQQADSAVDKHGDKITKGLDTAANKANRATKGKYAGQIDKGVAKAKDGLDKRSGPPPAGPAAGDPPPAGGRTDGPPPSRPPA